MPKIKEKTETIIILDQEEITPNKTNLLGAIKIKGIRTPKEAIATNTKGRIETTYGQISLVPFLVSMAIILTISPKLLTLNG